MAPVVLALLMLLTVGWSRGEEAARQATVVQPRCKPARVALVYYRARTWEWQEKKTFAWQDGPRLAGPGPRASGHSCDFVRSGVSEWRARARNAREKYERWWAYHYDWRAWLPAEWYSIGSCETGYGGPPNWSHSNSEFEGAFGLRGPGLETGAWLAHVERADPKAGPYPFYASDATPRQQYEHALVLHALYGWDPWGCA